MAPAARVTAICWLHPTQLLAPSWRHLVPGSQPRCDWPGQSATLLQELDSTLAWLPLNTLLPPLTVAATAALAVLPDRRVPFGLQHVCQGAAHPAQPRAQAPHPWRRRPRCLSLSSVSGVRRPAQDARAHLRVPQEGPRQQCTVGQDHRCCTDVACDGIAKSCCSSRPLSCACGGGSAAVVCGHTCCCLCRQQPCCCWWV